jgi:hypothetical protein
MLRYWHKSWKTEDVVFNTGKYLVGRFRLETCILTGLIFFIACKRLPGLTFSSALYNRTFHFAYTPAQHHLFWPVILH